MGSSVSVVDNGGGRAQSGRHVVVFTAVFPPEPVVSALMAADLATTLVSMGAKVTVLCPRPSRPLGVEYTAAALAEARPDGTAGDLRVLSLSSRLSPRSRIITRMWESWSFGRASAAAFSALGPVDVAYANTWPLFGQWFAWRACAKRRVPLVLHVQDIYPEAALHRVPRAMRLPIEWPLRAMDRIMAEGAARVVVNSEPAARYVVATRRLSASRVLTIRNWNREDDLLRLPDRTVAGGLYGINVDRLTFMYLGNIGPLAEVERLIAAFANSQCPSAQLIVVGDGDRKAACQDLARRLQIENVRFISEPRIERTAHLLALADVCLLALRPGSSLGSVPSKLVAYMLAAKPVLASVDVDSDVAYCIRKSGGGWYGDPTDSAWLTFQMNKVARMSRAELGQVGAAGRQYGLRSFSRANGLANLVNAIFQL